MIWLNNQTIWTIGVGHWSIWRGELKNGSYLFFGLQNLNDNLHFKELTTWSFCSCTGYLWSSSTTIMTSSYGVCVCGLGKVYVGCGWGKKLVLHWARSFKELGSNPPQVIGFAKTFYIGGANLWLENLILKAKDIFLTYVHILWLVWLWKLNNTYLSNENEYISIWSNVFLIVLTYILTL
jgi:hypothetical protein